DVAVGDELDAPRRCGTLRHVIQREAVAGELMAAWYGARRVLGQAKAEADHRIDRRRRGRNGSDQVAVLLGLAGGPSTGCAFPIEIDAVFGCGERIDVPAHDSVAEVLGRIRRFV